MIKINIAYVSKAFGTWCSHISIGPCPLQPGFSPVNRISRFGTENRCRPPFRILTAILLVCSFMLSAISRFKFMYAYDQTAQQCRMVCTFALHICQYDKNMPSSMICWMILV